ncbi:MAG: helix-turn-helix transcriptional regulator, partial [Anaerolineales bacterium]|nr:helix-turn-helix transcriptional regulator [Anaerolineales bacterium]
MIKTDEMPSINEKLSQELRRGSLVLAALSQLQEPKYGYALIDDLSRRGLDIEQGTLYPLLRRLEEQGLLRSEWNVDGSRPRRYYVLSPMGQEVLKALTADWLRLTQ